MKHLPVPPCFSPVWEKIPAVLDTAGKPTGWHVLDLENRSLIIRRDRGAMVEFAVEDLRSGTDLLRTRILARAYAVDHPFVPNLETGADAAPLVVQELYASTGARA